MTSHSLRFYAIPPALLLVVPFISLGVIIAFAHRSSRRATDAHLAQSFLPIFSISLLSLLVGGFGLAGIHHVQLASTSIVLLVILKLELGICLLSLISDFNTADKIPRCQLWIYNFILSPLLMCATLCSLISTFLPERVPSLLPPFLYLLFTTLTLPLIIYLILAHDSKPSSPRIDDPPPVTPSTSSIDFDTPPPSPSSTKQSFGIHHIDPPQPIFARRANSILPIHLQIHRPRDEQNRLNSGPDRRALLAVLLVSEIAALLSSAFEICVSALVPDVYPDLQDRLHGEVQLGFWRASVTLRCFTMFLIVISCGCTMTVWQQRSFCDEVGVTRRSWIPPITPHRLRHRRQLSTTSSFCSPGLRSKSQSPVIPFPLPSPRPVTPPTPTPKSHSSNVFNGIRSSIHSYMQPEPPRQGPRVRYQFPSLSIPLPTRPPPRRPQRVRPPQSPTMDAFNMNDPFAPPSPGAVPRQSGNTRDSVAGTTRLSAWGSLTLPVPRCSPPKAKRCGSNGGPPIVEEARLAEKLLERLDSQSE